MMMAAASSSLPWPHIVRRLVLSLLSENVQMEIKGLQDEKREQEKKRFKALCKSVCLLLPLCLSAHTCLLCLLRMFCPPSALRM